MLSDGYHDVPRGKVATIVTYLEMTQRPDPHPVHPPEGWRLERVPAPDRDWYLSLFADVGEDWLWFGRRVLPAPALEAILQDGNVHVHALRKDGVNGGFLELDFRVPGACELAYFGLTRPLIGSGAGRYLMNRACDLAWSADITRFHVHTCTIDSPKALAFYRKAGFVPVSQKVEIADDPRIALGYDRSRAPHVPIFDP